MSFIAALDALAAADHATLAAHCALTAANLAAVEAAVIANGSGDYSGWHRAAAVADAAFVEALRTLDLRAAAAADYYAAASK